MPFLLVGALILLTLGAAILGSVSKPTPSPYIEISASCQVLTADQAADLLGGKVVGPPLSPFLSPVCVYTRGPMRLAIRMVQQPAVVHEIQAIIDGRLALTCAGLSLPANCRVPTLQRNEFDGHLVAWLGDSDNPGTSGLAVTIIDGVVIETSAIHVKDVRAVVIGSMMDVLQVY